MGASFRLPLSNRTGCGRDARDPSEAPPNPARANVGGDKATQCRLATEDERIRRIQEQLFCQVGQVKDRAVNAGACRATA